MPNSRIIFGNVKEGMQLISLEEQPAKSIKYDQFGNVAPELNGIYAKNIMPSADGIMSYFGIDDIVLNSEAVLQDIQDVITYKTTFDETVLLALCADGVYLRTMAGDDIAATVVETATEITITSVDGRVSWKRGCYSIIPSVNQWKLWTYALLENKLYLYQKGLQYIAYFHSPEPGVFVFEKLSPSFIISAVAEAWAYSIAIDQEWTNSSFKTIDIGLGRSTVYIDSSAKAVETLPNMVQKFNVLNDNNASLTIVKNDVITGDIAAEVVIDNLPADFNITDSLGNPIPYLSWEETITPGGIFFNIVDPTYILAIYDLKVHANGKYYLTGNVYKSGEYRVLLVCLNDAFVLQWWRDAGGDNADIRSKSLTFDALGNIYVIKGSTIISLISYTPEGAWRFTKYNYWKPALFEIPAFITAITTVGTSVISVGTALPEIINARDLYIYATDSSGVELAERMYGIRPADFEVSNVKARAVWPGAILVDARYTQPSTGNIKAILFNLNPDGTMNWHRTYATVNAINTQNVESDPVGNMYMSAYLGVDTAVTLLKMDIAGNKIWEQSIIAPTDIFFSAIAEISLVIDSLNNTYQVLRQFDNNPGAGVTGAVIIKRNSAGVVLWQRKLIDTLANIAVTSIRIDDNDLIHMFTSTSTVNDRLVFIFDTDGNSTSAVPNTIWTTENHPVTTTTFITVEAANLLPIIDVTVDYTGWINATPTEPLPAFTQTLEQVIL